MKTRLSTVQIAVFISILDLCVFLDILFYFGNTCSYTQASVNSPCPFKRDSKSSSTNLSTSPNPESAPKLNGHSNVTN